MHCTGCMRKMLMLLSVHVTSVLFLVRFTLTMGFYWSYMFLLFERREKLFMWAKCAKMIHLINYSYGMVN